MVKEGPYPWSWESEAVGEPSRFLERPKGTLECTVCGQRFRDTGELYLTPRCPKCGRSMFVDVWNGKGSKE